MSMVRCPDCTVPLAGLGNKCWSCGWVRTREVAAPAAAIPDTRSEAEIRMAVRGVFETLQWVVIDFEQGYRPDGSTRVRRGTPDLYVMKATRSAWVEIKSATGKQSEHQRAFQRDCQACGIPYLLVRSEADAIEFARGIMESEVRAS